MSYTAVRKKVLSSVSTNNPAFPDNDQPVKSKAIPEYLIWGAVALFILNMWQKYA